VEHVISQQNTNTQDEAQGQFATAAELVANAASTTVFTPGEKRKTTYNQASLNRWRTILCTIMANRTPGDHLAISSLGEALYDNNQIEAAHLW
jgi:hypothetical protein